jgi:hypothetical protein
MKETLGDTEWFKSVILPNLLLHRQTFEEYMCRFVNAAEIPTQTLYDYFKNEKKIDVRSLDLTPVDELKVLETLETWYSDRDLAYPFPSTLQKQKEYWSRRLAAD